MPWRDGLAALAAAIREPTLDPTAVADDPPPQRHTRPRPVPSVLGPPAPSATTRWPSQDRVGRRLATTLPRRPHHSVR